MAKYTSNEVLDLLFEKPANEDDIDEDDFYGYVDDDNTVRGMMIQQDESIVDNGGFENEFGDIDEQSDSPMSEESLPLPEFSGSSSRSTDMSNKTPIDFFALYPLFICTTHTKIQHAICNKTHIISHRLCYLL